MKRYATELTNFPTLYKAWDLMLLDNVASAKLIATAREDMKSRILELPHPPSPAEAELATLTAEQLDVLCTGDEDERPSISKETEDILTYIFEELMKCPGR
jgi:hypothetical protein